MKTRLNGWQRIGIIISILWCFFIFGSVLYSYSDNDFEEDLSGMCPQLWKDFCSWHNSKTGEKLSLRIEGEKRVACETLMARATELKTKYLRGDIKPELRVDYAEVLLAIFLPVIIFWITTYTLVWIVKWVRAGFSN
ncbi:MAG: hypothetical protein AB1568_00545 [Thermodesulfobacteriota bacterium]